MTLFTHPGLRPIFGAGLADPEGLAYLRAAVRAGRRPGHIDRLAERQDIIPRSQCDRSPEKTRPIARAYRTALAGTG
jgi:hypothetical protein